MAITNWDKTNDEKCLYLESDLSVFQGGLGVPAVRYAPNTDTSQPR